MTMAVSDSKKVQAKRIKSNSYPTWGSFVMTRSCGIAAKIVPVDDIAFSNIHSTATILNLYCKRNINKDSKNEFWVQSYKYSHWSCFLPAYLTCMHKPWFSSHTKHVAGTLSNQQTKTCHFNSLRTLSLSFFLSDREREREREREEGVRGGGGGGGGIITVHRSCVFHWHTDHHASIFTKHFPYVKQTHLSCTSDIVVNIYIWMMYLNWDSWLGKSNWTTHTGTVLEGTVYLYLSLVYICSYGIRNKFCYLFHCYTDKYNPTNNTLRIHASSNHSTNNRLITYQ